MRALSLAGLTLGLGCLVVGCDASHPVAVERTLPEQGAEPVVDLASLDQELGLTFQESVPANSCTQFAQGARVYYACRDLVTRDQARSACQGIAGLDLVRINDAAENALIKANLGSGSAWIGANNNGQWRWTDGTQFWQGGLNGTPFAGAYANWDTLNPNLGSCAVMDSDGKWDSRSCGLLSGFVCEGDLCPSDASKSAPGVCGCGVADTDSDGDGRANCLDLCPNDPYKTEPGDCGCADAPAPINTVCGDGLCAANNRCNGAGSCGDPAACAPDTGCTFYRTPSQPGRGYFYCANATSWQVARQKCSSLSGSSLVRVDSALENSFLASVAPAQFWTAANDTDSEGDWRWARTGLEDGDQFWAGSASGSAVSGRYANWASGQPNNNPAQQDCARITPSTGKWSDENCTASAPFICELGAASCRGLQAAAPWPMAGRCEPHGGVSRELGAQTSDLNWATQLGSAAANSPAVSAEEMIYVSAGNSLYAVKSDGAVAWRFDTQGAVQGTAAIGVDGSIYIGSGDERMYALKPNGSLRWAYDTDRAITSSAAIASDGTIYFMAGDDLHAMTNQGALKWRKDTIAIGAPMLSAVGRDGVIYIGSQLAEDMIAFSNDGTRLWSFDANRNITSPAAVGVDETVYFGAQDRLYAVSVGGQERWRYAVAGNVSATPAIGPDGVVYATSQGGRLYAIKPDGTPKWEVNIGGSLRSSPAVGPDSTVYVGTAANGLQARRGADGSLLWQYGGSAALNTSPAVGGNGAVYAGGADGKLHSIGGGPEPRAICHTKVGPDLRSAIFAYENRALDVTIPLGAQNNLSPAAPASAPPGIVPVTTLQKGDHRAFTAFFAAGGSVTWTLRGRTAVASEALPECEASAHKALPGIVGITDPDHPSPPGEHAPQVAFDILAAVGSASNGGPGPGEGLGVSTQALTNAARQVPFTFSILDWDWGDTGLGACDQPDYDLRIQINGQSCGRHEIPGSTNMFCDRCLLGDTACCGACGVSGRIPKLVTCSQPVDALSPIVQVAIDLWEVDIGDDEHLIDMVVDIDNRTGQVISIANGGTLDREGRLVDRNWGLGWSVQTAAPPSVPAPKVCSVWNASFIDEEGEDRKGSDVPGQMFKHYPASFAKYQLKVSGPLGQATWSGFLDAEGCVPASKLATPDTMIQTPTSMPMTNVGQLFAFFAGAAVDDTANGGLSMEMTLTSEMQRVNADTSLVDYAVRRVTSGLTTDGEFDLARKIRTSSVFAANAKTGGIDITKWTAASGPWLLPPSTIVAAPVPSANSAADVHSDTSRVSAIVSALLATREHDGSQMIVAPGFYEVLANDGCPQTGLEEDSCNSQGAVFVGGTLKPLDSATCTTAANCQKNQVCEQGSCKYVQGSFWKYAVSHELGHQVQKRAVGVLGHITKYTYSCGEGVGGEPNFVEPSLCQGQKRLCPPSERAFIACEDDRKTTCTSTANCSALGAQARCVMGFCQLPRELQDPFGVDARCRCDHVASFNGRHCLQSIEEGGPAQGEGFAQYFASKLWNNPDESECAFSYYKETLLDTCPPGKTCTNMGYATKSQAVKPPTQVSCRTAQRWRNTFCGMNKLGDFGTELDWMTFLWNLNVTSANKLSLAQIYDVYRAACHGDGSAPLPCAGSGIAYEALYQKDVGGNTVLGPDGIGVPQWDNTMPCDQAASSCDATRGGVHDGALRTYGPGNPRTLHIEETARLNGVDRNLAP